MTRRAVALGAALVVALSIVTPYSDLRLNGTWVAACHLPVGAFFCFLVLACLLNPLLRWVAGRWALQPGELTVAYAMTLAGAGIPSFGLSAYLIPTLVGVGYFATPENAWVNWFYRFVPQWFVPFDLTRLPGSPVTALPACYRWLPHRFRPAGPELLRQFYEGLPGGQPVPWQPWVVPLVAWTALALLLFGVYYGLAVILRRQWIDRERLTFPLVQLPLALVHESDGAVIPGFLRRPAVWVGFAVPTLVHLVNGLHTYLPAVPELRMRYDLGPLLASPPWNQLGIFWLWIHFSVIGLTFLIPTDFSFSLWFFYLVFKLEGAALVQLGGTVQYMPNYATPRYAAFQMLGAFAVLFGYLWYAARPHLADVWRRTRRPEPEDEPLPARAAVGAVVLGLGGAAAILKLAGLPFGLGLLVLVLLLVVVMTLTRMIAEGGLLFVQAPFRPSDMLLLGTTAGALGPRTLCTLAFFERVHCFDLRATLWPYLMDSFRLADGAGVPRRKLTGPLALAILLAIGTSYAAVLYTAYRYGAVTQSGWFMIASPQQPFQLLTTQLASPPAPRPSDLATAGVGATVMLALCVLRNHYVGFALHPLGYAMGPSWPLIQLWFSLFLGWLCKSAVLRWSGMKGYRAAYPFFLGLILGEFVAAGCWVIVGMFAGTAYRFLLT